MIIDHLPAFVSFILLKKIWTKFISMILFISYINVASSPKVLNYI